MIAPPLPITYAGRFALVTGAGEGLGRATALHLAALGARVALLGRTLSDLKIVAAEIKTAGGEADVILADISKLAPMRAAFAKIKKLYGRLDFVFANAGVNGVWTPLHRLKVSEWDTTVAINLRGTFLTCKFALELMPKAGGSIVITSSVNGTRMFSNTGASAYAATKAAQVAFARMIALELAPRNVRVNTICPGAIESAIGDNTVQRGLPKSAPRCISPRAESRSLVASPAAPKTSPASSPSSAPTTPPTSPAPRSSSTVPNPCCRADHHPLKLTLTTGVSFSVSFSFSFSVLSYLSCSAPNFATSTALPFYDLCARPWHERFIGQLAQRVRCLLGKAERRSRFA